MTQQSIRYLVFSSYELVTENISGDESFLNSRFCNLNCLLHSFLVLHRGFGLYRRRLSDVVFSYV